MLQLPKFYPGVFIESLKSVSLKLSPEIHGKQVRIPYTGSTLNVLTDNKYQFTYYPSELFLVLMVVYLP